MSQGTVFTQDESEDEDESPPEQAGAPAKPSTAGGTQPEAGAVGSGRELPPQLQNQQTSLLDDETTPLAVFDDAVNDGVRPHVRVFPLQCVLPLYVTHATNDSKGSMPELKNGWWHATGLECELQNSSSIHIYH